MLKPLDRHRRDSTLFQFTSRRMRDFIDPDHLLIRIDEQFDFAKLAAPLEDRYCPDNGRPAIHPEVMIRALIICSLYNISSFRRLSSAIGENLAYRWFCFMTIDDPVFDHSTISYFIQRVGREGFAAIFRGLNEELLRLGLLSPEMYADSSLVKANVNSHQLSRSGLTVAEFRERAIEENGLFVLNQFKTDEWGGMGGNQAFPGFQGSSSPEPGGHRCPLAHQQARQAAGVKLPGQRRRGPGRLHPFPGSNPRFGRGMEGFARPLGAASPSAHHSDG